MTEYIGSKISLISKSLIRYTGILHEINSEESTVALEQEDRKPPAETIPSSSQIFDYIVFRGSDVKDLTVEEPARPQQQPPPAPAVPNDPSIITTTAPSSYHPTQRPSTSQTRNNQQYQQHGFDTNTAAPAVGYRTYDYGNGTQATQQMPRAYPDARDNYDYPRGQQYPQAQPSPEAQAPSSRLSRPVATGSTSSEHNQQASHPPPPPLVTKPNVPAKSTSTSPPGIKREQPVPVQSSKSNRVGLTPALPFSAPNARAAKPSGPSSQANFTIAQKPTSEQSNRGQSSNVQSNTANAQATPVDVQDLAKTVSSMRVSDVTSGPRSQPGSGAHLTRRGGGSGGKYFRDGNTNAQAKPSFPEGEFDFNAANAKFQKDELLKEILGAGRDNKESDHIPARNQYPAPIVSPVYNKSKSFFDDISCETKDRTVSERRDNREQATTTVGGGWKRGVERALNLETFGQTSVDRNHRGRGRGGRGIRGGRGFYSRGNTNRSRPNHNNESSGPANRMNISTTTVV